MKKLCELNNKKFKENKELVLSFSKDVKFICKKCLRVSNEKSVLCKSEKI